MADEYDNSLEYDNGHDDGYDVANEEWTMALKEVLPNSMLSDDEELSPTEVANYIRRLREGKRG